MSQLLYPYLYAPLFRPPGFASLPMRWPWAYVAAPQKVLDGLNFKENNPGVPLCDPKYRYGVIGSAVRLTPEQLLVFHLEWVNEPREDRIILDDVIAGEVVTQEQTTKVKQWFNKAEQDDSQEES